MCANKKHSANCPFPQTCKNSALLSGSFVKCRVENQHPVIFCSLAELPGKVIGKDNKSIKEYLDRHIVLWAEQKRTCKSDMTVAYLDAYEKIRNDIFGDEPEDSKMLNE